MELTIIISQKVRAILRDFSFLALWQNRGSRYFEQAKI